MQLNVAKLFIYLKEILKKNKGKEKSSATHPLPTGEGDWRFLFWKQLYRHMNKLFREKKKALALQLVSEWSENVQLPWFKFSNRQKTAETTEPQSAKARRSGHRCEKQRHNKRDIAVLKELVAFFHEGFLCASNITSIAFEHQAHAKGLFWYGKDERLSLLRTGICDELVDLPFSWKIISSHWNMKFTSLKTQHHLLKLSLSSN